MDRLDALIDEGLAALKTERVPHSVHVRLSIALSELPRRWRGGWALALSVMLACMAVVVLTRPMVRDVAQAPAQRVFERAAMLFDENPDWKGKYLALDKLSQTIDREVIIQPADESARPVRFHANQSYLDDTQLYVGFSMDTQCKDISFESLDADVIRKVKLQPSLYVPSVELNASEEAEIARRIDADGYACFTVHQVLFGDAVFPEQKRMLILTGDIREADGKGEYGVLCFELQPGDIPENGVFDVTFRFYQTVSTFYRDAQGIWIVDVDMYALAEPESSYLYSFYNGDDYSSKVPTTRTNYRILTVPNFPEGGRHWESAPADSQHTYVFPFTFVRSSDEALEVDSPEIQFADYSAQAQLKLSPIATYLQMTLNPTQRWTHMYEAEDYICGYQIFVGGEMKQFEQNSLFILDSRTTPDNFASDVDEDGITDYYYASYASIGNPFGQRIILRPVYSQSGPRESEQIALSIERP